LPAICTLYGAASGPAEEAEKAISFVGALRIPGVVEFSLCLFFAKLVSYTFLYWLPNYIHEKDHVDAEKAAVLSTIFDLGGIVGGVRRRLREWRHAPPRGWPRGADGRRGVLLLACDVLSRCRPSDLQAWLQKDDFVTTTIGRALAQVPDRALVGHATIL